ncbi:MAG TPA: hypothetical protein PLE30_02855 [Candidatus Kapabacteria bacterium]|nr:hypothetical protein [Candidatus Kapabacteria bacterium]
MKYILFIFIALLFISCDDNSTDSKPDPTIKVEKELLGTWSGYYVLGKDSVYYSVTFADGVSSPDVKGEIYNKVVIDKTTSTVSNKGTIYYTYNKPNIALRFYTNSDNNSFIGTLAEDGKSMVGIVKPYDIMADITRQYNLTLIKK